MEKCSGKGLRVPCGACGVQVCCNSIHCTKCQRWVHHCCSDVPRQVSLLSCWDVFVSRTHLGHSCSVEEKLEFKRGEDVLEAVERSCYLGDISCYGGASEEVSARMGSVWKKFRELSGLLVGKQGLSLKQQGKIYQCCIRPVLLHCCEMWKLTFADEAQWICGVRLVDRVSTNVLHDRVDVVVKIEDMIIQSRLWWYSQVIHGDISFQIREVMKVEITRKRKKGRLRRLWEECVKRV